MVLAVHVVVGGGANAPMQGREIKPDQLSGAGLEQVRVVNAFGVGIVVQPVGGGDDIGITEDESRKRFQFISVR